MAMFQIFVRAFDLDERLVGVAFLDVGVYVTSLRTLKNLLLIGDVVKSVWFVAFQVRSQSFSVSGSAETSDVGGPLQTRRPCQGHPPCCCCEYRLLLFRGYDVDSHW